MVSDIDFRLTRLESKTDKKFGGPSDNSPPAISGIPLAAGVNQIGESTGGPIISSGKPSILGKISEESLSGKSRVFSLDWIATNQILFLFRSSRCSFAQMAG